MDGLRRRVGDVFHGLIGQDVIIGIYDSGLDLTHEDFLDAAGRTRVLYAWDQGATSGRAPGAVGPHTLDYGAECGRDQIDAGACELTDRSGHGTHVAGSAAGDGSATGAGMPAYRYTGVAPGAGLIIVKGGEGNYTSDRLVDGVAYIFERAAELGRPAVVNLSLGTQAGPHDGTTLVERALDELSGPGRIVVASAGNQGTNRNETPAFARAPAHAQGLGAGEHGLVIPEHDPRPGAFNDGAVLELWYDGGDSLTIVVEPPFGEPVGAATGDSVVAATAAGAVLVYNGVGGPSPLNGDHGALIALVDGAADSPPAAGEWRIRVEPGSAAATGEYHLWLVNQSFRSGSRLARLEDGAVNTHLVTVPGSADRVLAVAAYTTKHRWEAPDDRMSYPFQEPLGDIVSFSSPGPRRDGVLKPEIAAPGKVIISARAREGALWAELPWLVERDGVHAALLGTSMAGPHVAGAVALLLQFDPTLTPENARALLTGAARQDEFTRRPYTGEPAGAPNAQWGHGKLDVAAAIRRLRPRGLVLADERVNLSENPVRDDRVLINYEEPPREVGVYTFAGQAVRRLAGTELGELFTVWDLTNQAGARVANGAYVVVVEFPDRRVMRKLLVLRP